MHRAASLLALALSAAMLATPAAAEYTLDDVELGEHWYGPPIAKEDLQGRVFLLEMWGRN